MKKVAELHLNDTIHILKKDFVDERINDRVWYETVEVKVKRLEYDAENNDIVINKGLEDGCALGIKEEVHTSASDARALAGNLNDHELAAELKVYKEFRRKADESKKIVDFFEKELKKVDL